MLTMTSMCKSAKRLAGAGVLALAGCSTHALQPVPVAVDTHPHIPSPAGELPAPEYTPPRMDSCNAQAASARVVGRQAGVQLEQQAMRLAGATSVRTLREGQPITREYRFGRLNLVVNPQNVIINAYCG